MAATWVSNIGCGISSGLVPDDFDVLAGGVKDLDHLSSAISVEERREVDASASVSTTTASSARRHLGDAQQRIVGGLPQEFGVDGDEGMLGKAGTGGLQLAS